MPRFEVIWPKGVGFRTAPNLESKAEDRVPARRGDVIEGELVDGWLATEEGLFLPAETPDGRPLLKKKPDFVAWRGCEEERPPSGAMGFPGHIDAPNVAAPPRARPINSGAAAQAGGNELDALHQKYDKKYGRSRAANAMSGAAAVASPFGQMGGSHDSATAYMHEFRQGLEEMGVDTRNDPYLGVYAPTSNVPAVKAAGGLPATSSSGAAARRAASGSRPGSQASSATRRSPLGTPSSGRGMSDASGGSQLALCGAMLVNRSATSGSGSRWREGPGNAIVPVKEWVSVKHGQEVTNTSRSGRTIDVSDRNIMCMTVLGDKAILGSADHGLKEINVRAGQVLRNLYTKRYGHSEWVTTASHCPDGRVLSGGMDSKLCLWNPTGVACVDLNGHLGSISRVRAHFQHNIAISSAYDKTLRAWDLRSKSEVACCTGHDSPVMDFIWANDVVASGDRGGTVRVWDACRAEHIAALKGHKGHITAMLGLPDSCASLCEGADEDEAATTSASGGRGSGLSLIATGAQDGHVRIWDLRQKLNTLTMSAHPGGAVNELGVTLGSGSPAVVSAGADGRVLVLDPRRGFAPLHDFGKVTEDFVYSLLVLDDIAFVGDGCGQVTCFDLRAGQQLYALSAGQNAIRCLGATSSSLVCAGDDGNAVIFDF